MLDTPQRDLSLAELDPDLLSTPFRVQTKWHVLTGAPSCGKTTLIGQLAGKGFQTAGEAARGYMERELAKGRTHEEFFWSESGQQDMSELKLSFELGIQANDLTFLDRAFPDYIAWYRFKGMDPNEILAGCFHHRYASINILDRLPIQLDGVRLTDDQMNDYFDHWHTRDYTALGYRIVRVPVLPPKERLEFILETLSAQGAI